MRGAKGEPAIVDLYLEGSDQHRGWFHSALLIGCAVLGRAPYKRVLTHGFVCDERGRPYSKSEIQRRREAGEKVDYIDPDDVIRQQGAEILRLWAAYEDYRNDVRYSRAHLEQVTQGYLKLRNTIRFLLGAVADAPSGPAPTAEGLDAWARARLRKYQREILSAYEAYDFARVYQRTLEICATEWSAFYLDVVKDRLYCDAENGPRRRATQAVLRDILESTLAALAPVLCFTTDEAWRHLPGESESSVFASPRLFDVAEDSEDAGMLAAGEAFFRVRDAVNAALEPKVKAREIGHRREARVLVALPAATRQALSRLSGDLAEALAVSEVVLADGAAIEAVIEKTTHAGCARCWRHRADVGSDTRHPLLCKRCADVVVALPETMG